MTVCPAIEVDKVEEASPFDGTKSDGKAAGEECGGVFGCEGLDWGGVARVAVECGDSGGRAIGFRAAVGNVGIPSGFLEGCFGSFDEVVRDAGFLKALNVSLVLMNISAVLVVACAILVDNHDAAGVIIDV